MESDKRITTEVDFSLTRNISLFRRAVIFTFLLTFPGILSISLFVLQDVISIKSINQTSITPISPVKPGSVAQQTNQCSTVKSRKQFHGLNGPSGVQVSMVERSSQRDVSSDAFWWYQKNGWMERNIVRLFQRDKGIRVKISCTCVGLDPREWQTIFVVWSQWKGWEWCGKHGVKINRRRPLLRNFWFDFGSLLC